jgi:glycosyltransferase involved in cell wall biosynthesis
MTLAVALATYNGARFLREQLECIARQTRHPDQMVISDDGSTDGTLEILDAFKSSVTFPVIILPRVGHLGVTGNFMRAAYACETDIIAFCDQDDIWEPVKLERCERALKDSGARLLFHSLHHFRDLPDGSRTWDRRSNHVKTATMDGLGVVPSMLLHGMAMLVRRETMQLAEPLKAQWEERFQSVASRRAVSLLDHWSHTHDTYALMAARLQGSLTFLSEPLAYRRQHDNNTSDKVGTWHQAPELEAQWQRGPGVGLLLWSEFCSDFADFLQDRTDDGLASAKRYRDASAFYRHWGEIWRARSRLADGEAAFIDRLRDIRKVGAMGGYRGVFNGGAGPEKLARDAFNLLSRRGTRASQVEHRDAR